jgi:hypothetical protein
MVAVRASETVATLAKLNVTSWNFVSQTFIFQGVVPFRLTCVSTFVSYALVILTTRMPIAIMISAGRSKE